MQGGWNEWRKEWELRPLVLAAIAFAVGQSAAVSAWHLVLLLPLLWLASGLPTRGILLAVAGLGVWMQPPLPQEDWFPDTTLQGTGQVVAIPWRTSSGAATVVEIGGHRWRWRLESPTQVGLGDRWQIAGVGVPLREGQTPIRGIRGQLELESATLISSGSGFWRAGQAVGESFYAFIGRFSTGVEPFVRAVTLNETSGMTPEDWTDFREAGVIHVVSASGLHVGILAAAVWLALGFTPIDRRYRLLILLLLVGVYAAAAGLRPPMIRAWIMAAFLGGAYFFRRDADGLSALAGASLLILLLDPPALWDIGFALSVVSLAALIMFGPSYRPGWPFNLGRWLKDAAQTSAVALLATVPLVSQVFGEVSLLGFIANIVVVPLAGIVVVFSLLAWLMSLVWAGLGVGIYFLVVAPVAQFTIWLMGIIADFPGGGVPIPAFSAYWCLPFLIGAMLIWRSRRDPA